MFYQNVKEAINHYVETFKGTTKISGYRLNTILNDIYDTITNVSWISQTITNGVIDKSPSEDAIYDALQGKVDKSSLPLEYYILFMVNKPISTQTSGSLPSAGMIITIETFVANDDFSNWELLSGTGNTTGDVYLATTDTPDVWSNGSDISYDGSPFIICTDVNGNFTPFKNTTGESPVLSRNSEGNYLFTWAAPLFSDPRKILINGNSNGENGSSFSYNIVGSAGAILGYYSFYINDSNSIYLESIDYTTGNATEFSNLFQTTSVPFKLEIYP